MLTEEKHYPTSTSAAVAATASTKIISLNASGEEASGENYDSYAAAVEAMRRLPKISPPTPITMPTLRPAPPVVKLERRQRPPPLPVSVQIEMLQFDETTSRQGLMLLEQKGYTTITVEALQHYIVLSDRSSPEAAEETDRGIIERAQQRAFGCLTEDISAARSILYIRHLERLQLAGEALFAEATAALATVEEAEREEMTHYLHWERSHRPAGTNKGSSNNTVWQPRAFQAYLEENLLRVKALTDPRPPPSPFYASGANVSAYPTSPARLRTPMPPAPVVEWEAAAAASERNSPTRSRGNSPPHSDPSSVSSPTALTSVLVPTPPPHPSSGSNSSSSYASANPYKLSGLVRWQEAQARTYEARRLAQAVADAEHDEEVGRMDVAAEESRAFLGIESANVEQKYAIEHPHPTFLGARAPLALPDVPFTPVFETERRYNAARRIQSVVRRRQAMGLLRRLQLQRDAIVELLIRQDAARQLLVVVAGDGVGENGGGSQDNKDTGSKPSPTNTNTIANSNTRQLGGDRQHHQPQPENGAAANEAKAANAEKDQQERDRISAECINESTAVRGIVLHIAEAAAGALPPKLTSSPAATSASAAHIDNTEETNTRSVNTPAQQLSDEAIEDMISAYLQQAASSGAEAATGEEGSTTASSGWGGGGAASPTRQRMPLDFLDLLVSTVVTPDGKISIRGARGGGGPAQQPPVGTGGEGEGGEEEGDAAASPAPTATTAVADEVLGAPWKALLQLAYSNGTGVGTIATVLEAYGALPPPEEALEAANARQAEAARQQLIDAVPFCEALLRRVIWGTQRNKYFVEPPASSSSSPTNTNNDSDGKRSDTCGSAPPPPLAAGPVPVGIPRRPYRLGIRWEAYEGDEESEGGKGGKSYAAEETADLAAREREDREGIAERQIVDVLALFALMKGVQQMEKESVPRPYAYTNANASPPAEEVNEVVVDNIAAAGIATEDRGEEL